MTPKTETLNMTKEKADMAKLELNTLTDDAIEDLAAAMLIYAHAKGKEDGAVARRNYLRRFATPFLMLCENKVLNAIDECEYIVVGGGKTATPHGCVQLRNRTITALRDMLNVDVLSDIIQHGDNSSGVHRVCLALIDPRGEGTASSSSKTGYVFGQHCGLVNQQAEKVVTWAQRRVADTGLDVQATLMHHVPEMIDPGQSAPAGGQGSEVEEDDDTPTLPKLDPAVRGMLDAALKSAGMPSVQDMSEILGSAVSERDSAKALASEVKAEMDELRKALAKAQTAVVTQPVVQEASGDVPSGKTVTVDAATAFGMPSLNFFVPGWEWDGVHPDVPEVDPNYVFREKELDAVLDALANNEVPWLVGHTGTGKTSLIEQVCARLNWPFICVSLDGHVTRGDLMGSVTLKAENGATVSEWIDGIIVRAMEMGAVLCLDELDAVAPDTSYAVQRPLEKRALKLLEDGGRTVNPHPMTRIVATGNTVGQGDETGQYPATRPQSMAFLGRFGSFIEIDYLAEDERRKLIKSTCPALEDGVVDAICRYLTEHIEAFKQGQIMLPTSPRDYLSLARKTERMIGRGREPGDALMQAFETSVLWRASQTDRPVVQAMAQRTLQVQ